GGRTGRDPARRDPAGARAGSDAGSRGTTPGPTARGPATLPGEPALAQATRGSLGLGENHRRAPPAAPSRTVEGRAVSRHDADGVQPRAAGPAAARLARTSHPSRDSQRSIAPALRRSGWPDDANTTTEPSQMAFLQRPVKDARSCRA